MRTAYLHAIRDSHRFCVLSLSINRWLSLVYYFEADFINCARLQFLRLGYDLETSVELKQMLHR